MELVTFNVLTEEFSFSAQTPYAYSGQIQNLSPYILPKGHIAMISQDVYVEYALGSESNFEV